MAHNSDYSYISAAANDGLSIDEIRRSLGKSSTDLGTLCVADTIKPFAKFKPQYHTTVGILAPAERNRDTTLPYSLKVLQSETAQLVSNVEAGLNGSWLCSDSFKIEYKRPTGGLYPYRQLDFNGYYNLAPATAITCATRGTVVYNSMDVGHSVNPIAFYAFFNGLQATQLNNKAFSATDGIDTGNPAVSSNMITYCITIGELFPTLISSASAHFCVLLYSVSGTTYTYVGTYPCYYEIADHATAYTGMYQIPLYSPNSQTRNGIYEGIINPNRHSFGQIQEGGNVSQGETQSTGDNPSSGTYTAVPALKFGNYYYPMYRAYINGLQYGKPFTLKIGGQDFYESRHYAIGTSSNTPSTNTDNVRTLSVNDFGYTFLTEHIWNVEYDYLTDIADVSKFRLHCHLSVTYKSTQETGNITYEEDRTNIAPSFPTSSSPASARTIPATQGQRTGPDGSNYTPLIFPIKTTRTLEYIDHATIVISNIRLYYDGVVIGKPEGTNQGRAVSFTINYT